MTVDTRQLDRPGPTVTPLLTLDDIASAERDWQSAHGWYCRALSAANPLVARGVAARILRHYAAMCAARGNPRAAVRLSGATSQIRDFPLAMMVDPPASEDQIVTAARQAIGADECALAWSEGLSITLEQATAEILSEDAKKTSGKRISHQTDRSRRPSGVRARTTIGELR